MQGWTQVASSLWSSKAFLIMGVTFAAFNLPGNIHLSKDMLIILQRTGKCTGRVFFKRVVGNASRQDDLDGPVMIILWSSAQSVGRSLVIDLDLITSCLFFIIFSFFSVKKVENFSHIIKSESSFGNFP